MRFSKRQLFALLLCVILIINMVLFALGKNTEVAFWTVLGGCAVLWFALKRQWAD